LGSQFFANPQAIGFDSFSIDAQLGGDVASVQAFACEFKDLQFTVGET